jgi:preprotein translocase subunit SecG
VGILVGILQIATVLLCIFLVGVILIQRGKGGGLAGAFGGAGGSSAFGTKAGDVFTRITGVTAIIWMVFCMVLLLLMNQNRGSAFDSDTPSSEVKTQAAKSTRSKTASSSSPANKPAESAAGKPSGPSSSTSEKAPVDLPAIPDLPPPR